MSSCPFCTPPADRILFEGARVFALWDGFPVSPGHALIIPRRHVPSLFEATPQEQKELMAALTAVRARVLDAHPDIAGFNIGINDGRAAGQTVDHLHIHLIPRYVGDHPDPTGGVRHVMPEKANYLQQNWEALPVVRDAIPGHNRLVTGAGDPLLPHLQAYIGQAERVDIAVAFLRQSGFSLLSTHLQELLERGGKLRLITGDYLAITEPQTLHTIYDWMQRPEFINRIQARLFCANERSFHPKAYLFQINGGADRNVAIVGSTNLSKMALTDGIEWNYQVFSAHDPIGYQETVDAFEALWAQPSAVPLSEDVIRDYSQRFAEAKSKGEVEADPEEVVPPPSPHRIQREALDALEDTRAQGYKAGLVVLATGLGKTWLSAFDSMRADFKRVLFVAHREEILAQSMSTFRRIRPQAHLGLYSGQRHDPHAEVLFASVQTLSRPHHLHRFEPDAFDYIVIDEFHHATAQTYRRIIDYFEPKFTLGLTATPERMDGGDLLALCQYNRVYRCDIPRAIELNLLSPFHYYGIPDDVEYDQIPWRNRSFDIDELTRHWATQQRAQNALEQYQKRGGSRTLAFCCSIEHANFMRDFFSEAGLRTAAVHSGVGADRRSLSLEALGKGELDVVFAVDMFNEGIDVPEIDTVFMLRPTESKVIWLQQLGRGLRWAEGKVLQVLDYIGNHRVFRVKPEVLFEVLMGIGPGRGEVARALEKVRLGEAILPVGCEVTYELETLDILDSVIGKVPERSQLETYYDDFRSVNGRRPDAVELYEAGYDPKSISPQTWLQFVGAQEPSWRAAQRPWLEGQVGQFLESLERTPMTKSYKMLLLSAVLKEGCLPGSIGISELTTAFIQQVFRSPRWRNDVAIDLNDVAQVRKLLIKNPISNWCEGKGTGGVTYFAFDGGVFRFLPSVSDVHKESFQGWVQEIIDWRLSEYVSRLPNRIRTQRTQQISETVQLGQSYKRSDIPLMFGLEYKEGLWRQTGVVDQERQLFLLVTLDKGNKEKAYQYRDKFISPDKFQWQSQNSTSQLTKRGQKYRHHKEQGIPIHLFVRPKDKVSGVAAPFYYCGQLEFERWEGEKPITIWWSLKSPLPEYLRDRMGI